MAVLVASASGQSQQEKAARYLLQEQAVPDVCFGATEVSLDGEQVHRPYASFASQGL